MFSRRRTRRGKGDEMTAEPLTRDELRQELTHYATKADLGELKAEVHALETRLTVRLLTVVGLATGIIIAVDRLWT